MNQSNKRYGDKQNNHCDSHLLRSCASQRNFLISGVDGSSNKSKSRLKKNRARARQPNINGKERAHSETMMKIHVSVWITKIIDIFFPFAFPPSVGRLNFISIHKYAAH